ncbi:hypothetical protein [Maricaulis sp. CAU 1757]
MAQAKQPTEVTMKDVKSDITELRQDVDALFANLATIAQQTAEHQVERTGKVADKTVKAAEEYEEELRGYISKNPLYACGAALGLGFIGAMLLRR